MKHKEWLLFILGVLVCGAVVFGSAEPSLGDDGFYVIPVTNPNIKMVNQNTALGIGALQSNTTGDDNTASGYQALYSNITGDSNTASGFRSLYHNTTGSNNTACGSGALISNTTGIRNTACGGGALSTNVTGTFNTALGFLAGNYSGVEAFTGHHNIYIGYNVGPAAADESDTIRIGNDSQSRTFIKGISGITVPGGVAVYVKSDGQLGTSSSSRRFKQDIRDMADATSGLMRLRPVTFHYKPEYAGGPHTLQYGLIAEEVAEVYPELVQYDPKSGEPQTVSYHLVNAMLLNEVQKQQRRINELEKRLSRLEASRDK